MYGFDNNQPVTREDSRELLTHQRDALAKQLSDAIADPAKAPDAEWIERTNEELSELNARVAAATTHETGAQVPTRDYEIRFDNQAFASGTAGKPMPARHESRVSIGHESRMYVAQEHRAPGAPDYLHDLMRAQIHNDPSAGERLARHSREVEVESPDIYHRVTTSGGAGAFVPPAYLTAAWAEYARAGRPVANLVTQMALPPEGMTVYIPKITTPTQTGVQTTEGDTIDTADLDETTLSVPVRTIAGYTDLSRQSIDRGQMFESVVFGDLAADYARRLDTQIINGDGTSGAHTGLLNTSSINTVTYTDASPTLAELWPKLASAVGQVVSQRFSGPTAIILNPSTWAWMLSVLDSSSRPFVTTSGAGPNNAVGISNAPTYDGSAGTIMGLPVILDGNVPSTLGGTSTETRIIIADFRDSLLLEDSAPVQAKFEQVGSANLVVRLQVWGYSAFTAARQPKAVSVIAGTGLITPSL